MSASKADAQLWGEMSEQPAVVAHALSSQRNAIAEARRALKRGIVFVARGSSRHASIYGRYLFEVRNGLLTSMAYPSTQTLYGARPGFDGFAVIAVSQSGQGTDTLAYVDAARKAGAVTIAVVNDPTSPLARRVQIPLFCGAGKEVSVPATKSVTAQMALLAAVSGLKMGSLPHALEATLALRAKTRRMLWKKEQRRVFVIARGFGLGAAYETALKLKEMAYVQAEAFSAAEFRHGPIVLVEKGTLTLCIDVGGESTASCVEAAAEVKRRGGSVLWLRVGKASAKPALQLEHAELDEPLAPIPAVVMGQLLALELGLSFGLDPSSPRGLKKVTRTR